MCAWARDVNVVDSDTDEFVCACAHVYVACIVICGYVKKLLFHELMELDTFGLSIVKGLSTSQRFCYNRGHQDMSSMRL